jgi:hypothetical protein
VKTNIIFPPLLPVSNEPNCHKSLYIAACGSEERSLGWLHHAKSSRQCLASALLFRYKHTKGNRNRVSDVRNALADIGISNPYEAIYDTHAASDLEDIVSCRLSPLIQSAEEIILDISAMTKLLILVCLCTLRSFSNKVRIAYSEAQQYVPSEHDYLASKSDMKLMTNFPSRGFQSVVRARCLGSTRMQGQPVTLIAFTSFNEQLVRSMLGTISPHSLIFINGRPPRPEYAWRERATQEIHEKLIQQYRHDNPIDDSGHLTYTASSLYYSETILLLDQIYNKYGTYERLVCAATGSKMQTLGLFLSKVSHPDFHIEYPTPDSYFITGPTTGTRAVYEIRFPDFAGFLTDLSHRTADKKLERDTNAD